MTITKHEKSEVVERITDLLSAGPSAAFADMSGLDAERTSALRTALAKDGIGIITASKNVLARAAERSGRQHVVQFLGPLSAVIHSERGEDLVTRFGLCAAFPVASMLAYLASLAPITGDDSADACDTFDVELTDAGSNKIGVIKVVREVTGLGLKEAKDMVDGAPKVIKEKAAKSDAEEIKKKIEEAGGLVTLK